MVPGAREVMIMVLEDITETSADGICTALLNDQMMANVRTRPVDSPDWSIQKGLLYYEGSRVYIPGRPP